MVPGSPGPLRELGLLVSPRDLDALGVPTLLFQPEFGGSF